MKLHLPLAALLLATAGIAIAQQTNPPAPTAAAETEDARLNRSSTPRSTSRRDQPAAA